MSFALSLTYRLATHPSSVLTCLCRSMFVGCYFSNTRLPFPNMSSYNRLIVHRLADAYRLRHVVAENSAGERVVVLYKQESSAMYVFFTFFLFRRLRRMRVVLIGCGFSDLRLVFGRLQTNFRLANRPVDPITPRRSSCGAPTSPLPLPPPPPLRPRPVPPLLLAPRPRPPPPPPALRPSRARHRRRLLRTRPAVRAAL